MRRFAIAFVSLIALSACNAAQTNTDATLEDENAAADSSAMMEDASSSDGSMIDVEAEAEIEAEAEATIDGEDSSASDQPQAAAPRVVEIAVSSWTFAPNTINAAVGEKVIVRLVGGTGTHSFASTELGINVSVGPGETIDVELPTDTAGTFTFRCMIPCGAGHADMTGTIVIG